MLQGVKWLALRSPVGEQAVTYSKKTPAPAVDLRRRAEDKLRERDVSAAPPSSEADTAKLLHELTVHQIELEMQNEELLQSRAEIEAGLAAYSDLYDFAPIGYFTLAADGTIRQANLAGARLFGLERARLVGRRFAEFVSESDRSEFIAFLTRTFAGRAKETCEAALFKRVDGGPSSGVSDNRQFYTTSRRVLRIEATAGEDGHTCRAVVFDVTERRLIEKTQMFLLRRGFSRSGEDFFQSLARYLADTLEMDFVRIDRLEGSGLVARPVAVFSDVPFEKHVDYALNDTPCGKAGEKPVCSVAKGASRLFPNDVLLRELTAESYVGITLWDSKGDPSGLLAVIGRQPRENLQIAETIVQLAAGRAAGELERRQADEALRKANDELEDRVLQRTLELEKRATQLSELAFNLTQVEIRERKRLAQFLHDDLQQLLVCAKLSVSTAMASTAEATPREALEDATALLDQSIEASRTLTSEISPPILNEGDLAGVLDWAARWMREKHGLTVALHVEANVETRLEVRVLVFQVVRELLFNVVKHAGVDRAELLLRRHEPGELTIVVSDKGKGFEPGLAHHPEKTTGGFGLFSICERLQWIGGRCEIVSAPGRGTEVSVFAPTA
jgi:PAS domain S-box-containing protein